MGGTRPWKDYINNCRGKYMNKYTFDDIKEKFALLGYEVISSANAYKNTKSFIDITDGRYKCRCKVERILYHNPTFSRQMFACNNPYIEHNIKCFLEDEKNGNFKLITKLIPGTFTRNDLLQFKCTRCGEIINTSLFNARRKEGHHKGLTCPYCDGTFESMHAIVLKQLFMKYKSNTELEDPSCINPLTGAILPTDIVNHKEKIAIEIQSVFHLRESQKIKDKIKKEYWVSRGYNFYDYFIEDYSVLEYCQLFFPELQEIPKWVKTTIINKLNYNKIQAYINSGHSIQETATYFNINTHRIYDALHNKHLYYPEEYWDRYKKSLVQLDIHKNYIDQFSSYQEAADKTGILKTNIISCVNSKRYYANGYYWIPLKDYQSGTYTIPYNKLEKYYYPVNIFDIDGNYLSTEDDVYAAEKKTNVPAVVIMDIIKGYRGSRYGYKFKYA